MNDQIIKEIRDYRQEHSKKFNYDLDAICNDFKSKHHLYIEKLKEKKEGLLTTNKSIKPDSA